MKGFDKLDKTSLLGFDTEGQPIWDISLPNAMNEEADSKASADAQGLSVAVGGGKVPGVTKD